MSTRTGVVIPEPNVDTGSLDPLLSVSGNRVKIWQPYRRMLDKDGVKKNNESDEVERKREWARVVSHGVHENTQS